MYNNYFILIRLFKELSSSLKGTSVISVLSQERDLFHLIIGKELNSEENIILEFSTVPNAPYLLKRKYFKPAGKNLAYFFRDELPQRLIDVKVACGERIFMLLMERGSLIISFRGARSNIYYLDQKGFDLSQAKKNEGKSFFEENPDLKFVPLNEAIKLDVYFNSVTIDAIRGRFPFMGKAVLRELGSRSELHGSEEINKLILEIINGTLKIVNQSSLLKLELLPDSFHSDGTIIKSFGSVIPALQEIISGVRKRDAELQIRKRVEVKLRKDLDFFIQKAEKLEQVLNTPGKSEFYDQCANLLLINLEQINKGVNEITVENVFNNGELVDIKLKEDISPSENVNYYFRKARGEKLKYETAEQSLTMVKQKIVDLKTRLKIFEKMDLNELRDFEKENKSDDGGLKGGYKIDVKVRRFFLDNKWEILVGKDSVNNDILTLKVAKQTDYWFHARGSSGSHVVLRFSGKDKPPKDILKKTAQIAAFYSKAKNSKLVPVCYTQKKYVVKRKGMDPGQVSLLREEVVMVPPQIPEGCISDTLD